jgi:hypothetical protein
MVSMRWVVAVGLIAGCGRIGFDPSVEQGGGPGDQVDAPAGGSDMASAHYITGGSASQQVPIPSVVVSTGPLAGDDMVVVVAIHWRDASASVTTVLDTFGNGFSTAIGMTRLNTQSQIMWFKRVTAGVTMQVLFDRPAVGVDVKWAAYRDIDPQSSIGGRGGAGTSATAATGDLPVNGPAVVVASSASRSASATAGPGFSQRHAAGGGVLEDRDVAEAGTVNATATLSASDDWIIQAVALRPR